MPSESSDPSARATRALARSLGYASFGLAGTELAIPDRVLQAVGVPPTATARAITRVAGARELAHASAIVAKPEPVVGVWTRVAGDVIDLALLGVVARMSRNRTRTAVAAAAVLGISAVDVVTAVRLTRASRRTGGRGAVRVRASTTVHKSPEEAYAFWRSVERLPTFMAHLQTVEPTSDKQSHWVARGPAGRTVEWDAEIVADEPGRQIAWQSLPETEIENSGTVRFTPAPAGQGTEVSVELEYRPPAGRVGAAVATLFGEEPLQQVNDDLRRFKQVLEAGAIVRSDASPDGVHTAKQLKQRPAQPVAA